MNKTEITKEQLAKMSDAEIDSAIVELLCKITGLNLIPKSYCHDWSATGPLMLEYKISFLDDYDEGRLACSQLYIDDLMNIAWDYSSDNENPLRAICEVILMMGGKS